MIQALEAELSRAKEKIEKLEDDLKKILGDRELAQVAACCCRGCCRWWLEWLFSVSVGGGCSGYFQVLVVVVTALFIFGICCGCCQ